MVYLSLTHVGKLIMRYQFIKPILTLLAITGLSMQVANATHLRAGEITVRRLSCTGLTFEITITVYTNTGSEIRFGDGILDFGDGSAPVITPTIQNGTFDGLPPNVGFVRYPVNHTFPGPGRYVISYLEPNRNAGILNMFNSVETRFYLETVINIDPFFGCDNSPRLLVPPIDKACTGAAWFHNPGAFDPDGDSLSFEFTVPKRDKNQDVINYRDPNVQEFYDRIGLAYGTANETQDGPPTFSINSRTGTIVWNAPGAPGEYNIAFIIRQWRFIAGEWRELGRVTRDMQIIVEDCDNERPELEVPEDICVEAGETVTEDIFGFDPDGDDVQIEVFSQLLSISPSPATFSPRPPVFQTSSPSNKAKLTFTWNTDCLHVKEQPYQVVFKITDKPQQGVPLVEFRTWNITVVGPAPTWNNIALDLPARAANLTWDSYTCQNATTMQVWRKVNQTSFTPPECVTGMPDFLGYTRIADVPISQTTYRDTNNGTGLRSGAQYCYRLVAVFPLPGGGESYVSRDTCLPPIIAEAPVITNVTVDRTDAANGEITVKWRSPLDIDRTQNPPPYTYEVFRAEGFSGEVGLVKAHAGRLTDSSFVDTGINTEETVYNYRVIAFDNNDARVDTSDAASSVRLEPRPLFQRIQLNWSFDVPWSNQTQDFPRHLIFRGPEGATEGQLVLIDSVNVNQRSFTYIDSGQFQNTPLLEDQVYCYRVMTRGSYGNPKIAEPLVNFSQIICAQPNDDDPPCTPDVVASSRDCAAFVQETECAPLTFSNVITWRRPSDADCRADIRSYKIWEFPDALSSDSSLLAENVRDTFFIHNNISSFARCYKIAAVDRAGNQSALSERICFDNCPHYELPNVFTPNGDLCNEVFSAFSDRDVVDENGNGPCGPINVLEQRARCARFVEKVDFTVVNRWGKTVYTYESGAERSIYIDWNGRDNDGNELSEGIYYYVAEVTFNVVDPSQRNQTIRGWVHLIR